MKLTSREKVMLLLLAIVAVVGISYYFIVGPQLDRIANLTLENADLKEQVQAVKMELAGIGKLTDEVKTLDESIQKKTEPFYPIIYQDRFIVLFNGLVKETGVNCSTISFSEPLFSQVESQVPALAQTSPLRNIANKYKELNGSDTDDAAKTEGAQAADAQGQGTELLPVSEYMSVTMQIKAPYTNWIAFLKKIENLNRTVTVKNLVLSYDEMGGVSGSILVNIYAIPKLQDQDKDNEYLEWPFKGRYGRTNPFAF